MFTAALRLPLYRLPPCNGPCIVHQLLPRVSDSLQTHLPKSPAYLGMILMIQAHGPSPWEKSNKWLSLLNSLTICQLTFLLTDHLRFLHTFFYCVGRRGHTPFPSVPWTFWEGSHVFLFPQDELCGTEVSSEWCNSFWLWRAHWRSLHPWAELCPLTAKKHTWGFLNCYVLSESSMHVRYYFSNREK